MAKRKNHDLPIDILRPLLHSRSVLISELEDCKEHVSDVQMNRCMASDKCAMRGQIDQSKGKLV